MLLPLLQQAAREGVLLPALRALLLLRLPG
jgi:hypothetical protein